MSTSDLIHARDIQRQEDWAIRMEGLLESIDKRMARLLAHIEERAGSTSSVEIKTSARGNDVAVKVYEGSDVNAAGEAAMVQYCHVVAEMNHRLVDAINGGKAA